MGQTGQEKILITFLFFKGITRVALSTNNSYVRYQWTWEIAKRRVMVRVLECVGLWKTFLCEPSRCAIIIIISGISITV